MVDFIRPSYQTVRPNVSGRDKEARVKEASAVETHTDDKEAGQDYIVDKDRRKRKDRRKGGGNKRSLYDMRASRGRRKEDGGEDGIEVEV